MVRRRIVLRLSRLACLACLACLVCLAGSARADDASGEPGFLPIARFAGGVSHHVSPQAERGTYGAFDVGAGLTFNPTGVWRDEPGVYYSAELGYSYDGIGTHAFQLAPGVGFGNTLVYGAYHPRLLLGSGAGDTLVGMRNGLAVHLLADSLSFEVGHQFAQYGGGLHHDVRALAGLNLAVPVYLVARFLIGAGALARSFR